MLNAVFLVKERIFFILNILTSLKTFRIQLISINHIIKVYARKTIEIISQIRNLIITKFNLLYLSLKNVYVKISLLYPIFSRVYLKFKILHDIVTTFPPVSQILLISNSIFRRIYQKISMITNIKSIILSSLIIMSSLVKYISSKIITLCSIAGEVMRMLVSIHPLKSFVRRIFTLKSLNLILIRKLIILLNGLKQRIYQSIIFIFSSVGRIFRILRATYSVGLISIRTILSFGYDLREFLIVVIYKLQKLSPKYLLKAFPAKYLLKTFIITSLRIRSIELKVKVKLATLKYLLKKYIKRRRL